MKNVTLSAEDELIEQARQIARAKYTTLNKLFGNACWSIRRGKAICGTPIGSAGGTQVLARRDEWALERFWTRRSGQLSGDSGVPECRADEVRGSSYHRAGAAVYRRGIPAAVRGPAIDGAVQRCPRHPFPSPPLLVRFTDCRGRG